jgi:ubiquitin C-terminal hydrolase
LEKHVESVDDALKHFTTTEDCDWYCDVCKSRIPNCATKQLLIFNTPRSFILHIKRFTSDPSSGKSVKNHRHIAFPVTLDVTPFIFDDSDEKQQSVIVELYGVLVHHGQTANSGHYIAFVKCLSTGKWYLMNDDKRREVTWEFVEKQQAFILFYSKRDPSFPAPLAPVAENAASASKNRSSNLALSATASSPSSTDSESSKDEWTVVKNQSKAKK